MIHLFLISLLVAASSGLKAIRFGDATSATTLFPLQSSLPTSADALQPNETKHEHTAFETFVFDREEDSQAKLADHDIPEERNRMNDHFNNKDGDEWGLYVPIDLQGETTVVRRAIGLEKRAQPAGTVQMDCYEAPEICRNVGFYQNCLMKAHGDHTKVSYENGPDNDKKKSQRQQRKLSGVTTRWSTPCKAWPFAQRFWNLMDETRNIDNMQIQTDEWPMAIMTNAWGPVSPAPRMSLRCMHNLQNSRGGGFVEYFRQGTDNYATVWAHHRTIPPGVKIGLHDTYSVQFNFDKYPKTRAEDPARWDERVNSLQWAEATQSNWDAICKNDWRQFRMTERRGGALGEP